MATSSFPCDPTFDSTFAFLREGYRFIGNRCDRLKSDLFTTRLMLRKVTCMRGPAAAEQFYREGRFTRRGAMPATVLTLLQDRGSVQTLDGSEHRHRKQMFMLMMSPASVTRGREIFRDEWQRSARRWRDKTVVLHDRVGEILTRTGLRWCGLDPELSDALKRAQEFQAMIDGAGSIGPRQIKGQFLRARSEAWARSVFRDIRSGALRPGEESPAAAIIAYRDPEGRPLPASVAAVELINLLRPITAITRFVVFAAHALYEHPEWRDRLASAGDEEVRAFVQEVRRFYPFFPVIGGRVIEPFSWRGHRFAQGDWVLLDLYGTNRHPDGWEEPEAFRPERFLAWEEDAHSFVAQGGGGFLRGHRCPGEWLTIGLMIEAVRLLVAMEYEVPDQDLTIRMNRFPALPESGFVIRPFSGPEY
jgi:fatty-acid peroxygenase